MPAVDKQPIQQRSAFRAGKPASSPSRRGRWLRLMPSVSDFPAHSAPRRPVGRDGETGQLGDHSSLSWSAGESTKYPMTALAAQAVRPLPRSRALGLALGLRRSLLAGIHSSPLPARKRFGLGVYDIPVLGQHSVLDAEEVAAHGRFPASKPPTGEIATPWAPHSTGDHGAVLNKRVAIEESAQLAAIAAHHDEVHEVPDYLPAFGDPPEVSDGAEQAPGSDRGPARSRRRTPWPLRRRAAARCRGRGRSAARSG
jgi:hypothetical protein